MGQYQFFFLLKKIEIKPETGFYDWLEREISERFDYACCDSLEDFRRRQTALTKKGQIKSRGHRHEKDDRHHIDDRSRYILGWDNLEKIKILQRHLKGLDRDFKTIVARVQALDEDRKKAEKARDLLQNILGFESFSEIHWQMQLRKYQQ